MIPSDKQVNEKLLPHGRNIQTIQWTQSAASRPSTLNKRGDHITPILAALHWLHVSFRIDFKVLLLIFKQLHGKVPPCICDLLTPYEPDHCLR